VGRALNMTVQALEELDSLDLRRVRRIVVAADFGGELAELYGDGRSAADTHTNEQYAFAVAKVLVLPDSNGWEIVPALNAAIAALLVADGPEQCKTQEYQLALHVLHHELGHVHDNNKRLDAFGGLAVQPSYSGKEAYIRPLADICWQEFAADVFSYSTLTETIVAATDQRFADAIDRTKAAVDREVLDYRYHGDLPRLLAGLVCHSQDLLKAAAEILGCMEGTKRGLSELSPVAEERLRGSYFEPTWASMRSALHAMLLSYPDGWSSLRVYDPLAKSIEDLYAVMGLALSDTVDGQCYLHVPFRPETTP